MAKEYPNITVEEYIQSVTPEKKETLLKIREVILKNMPKGYEECMSYGMLSYVVPHSIYPAGYHCNPQQPLPFVALAAQKNSINLYHMGIYAQSELMQWFQTEYAKECSTKLDMGKSCIRFKKPQDIPYKLIAQLMKKISVKQWINIYENAFIKK